LFFRKQIGPEALQLVRESLKGYRVDAPRIEHLREALKCYVGTKMYHNFTTGKHPTDANARRYIISFTCGEPFVEETSGAEWVLISVVGQSFLLNQIRKMIGLAAEVATGHAPFSMMNDALSKQKVTYAHIACRQTDKQTD
jgi:tRNA pseudouridine38-40 synthase